MTKSSKKPPMVSVIIPHLDDVKNLERCLAALESQSLSREAFEIIVADNGSACGHRQLQKAIAGRANLVVVSERGAGPARNGGVNASHGRSLAFIDSDCVPTRDWLEEGLKALRKHDFVGGKVVVSVNDERHVTPTEAFEKVFAFDFNNYINRKGFTGSGNLFVPRTVFQTTGGFRNGVSEDVEWSRRTAALGYRLGYAPRAVVSHPARRNWSELRRKWARINRESFALMLQSNAGRSRWVLRTMALPASAIVHAPRALTSRRLKGYRERLGAVGILMLCRLWRFGDALKLALQR